MKKYFVCVILLLLLTLLFTSCLFEDDEEEWDAAKVCPETGMNAYGMPNRGTFVDERDGRVYKYTTIGDQVWMAENLKFELPYPYSLCYGKETCYLKRRWEGDVGVYTCFQDTAHLAEIGQRMQSTCTDNDCIAEEWCEKVGRYYALMEGAKEEGLLDRDIVDTVCPKGWHIPTKDEWEILHEAVESITPRVMSEEAYVPMDSFDYESYRKRGGVVSACGFSAYYAGYCFSNGRITDFFKKTFFGTSTAWSEVGPYAFTFNQTMSLAASTPKVSIRCLKD